ncbi:MAG: hypothetical protein ACJ768_05895 [Gaiellaceae bacterium]
MRPFAVHADTLQLGLADVPDELVPVVERLGFERAGMVFVRRFSGDMQYAAQAAERFELCAEAIVRQLADLDPVPWEDALQLVVDRVGADGWMLVGSAARAVRGLDAAPHDLDLVSDSAGAERIALALADLLVEPLVDGGWIGGRWYRAFGPARIEGVGDYAGTIVHEGAVVWRGVELRVGRVA